MDPPPKPHLSYTINTSPSSLMIIQPNISNIITNASLDAHSTKTPSTLEAYLPSISCFHDYPSSNISPPPRVSPLHPITHMLFLCCMSNHPSLIKTTIHHHHLSPNTWSSLKNSRKPMSLVLFLPYTLLNATWNNFPLALLHHPTTWNKLQNMSTIFLVASFPKNKPFHWRNTSLGLSIFSLVLIQNPRLNNIQTLNQPLPLPNLHL